MNDNEKILSIADVEPWTETERSCPYCQSVSITGHGTSTTLIGGGPNVNHEWTSYDCQDCGKPFTHETKYKNVWYTDGHHMGPGTLSKGIVLRGVPGCFENYIYPCRNGCGHTVLRVYFNKKTKQEATLLSKQWDGEKYIKDYDTFFACEECGASVKLENQDYYYMAEKAEKPKPITDSYFDTDGERTE